MAADRVSPAAAGVAAGTMLLTVLLQAWSGAYHSEFGAHPDESAHYVTGVMVREYLAALAPGSPLRFAQDYYAHYPKVAIGHWPPAFYLLQAVWTLLFSPSRVSVLLLMAVLTAGLATAVFLTLRDQVGGLLAAAAATLLPVLPLMQKASGMVMAEIPLALFCFGAVLAFGRFLDFGRTADAVVFGLASAAAILTKGNGFVVLVAVPLAVVLTRRWERLARPALWASAALVAALCSPWYIVAARMTADHFGARTPTREYALAAARLYTRELTLAVGFGLGLLAAIGLVDTVARPWLRRRVRGNWAAAAGLLIATWAFHCIVPSSREPRHMVMALPALMMFVAAGIAVTARWAGSRAPRFGHWRLVVVAIAATLFAWEGFAVPAKSWSGFAAPVERLLRSPGEPPSVMLIVSDVLGEGMFISELAMREPRPRRTVLRGSKVLAQSGWDGEGYHLLYRSSADVLDFLDTGVEAIVLDTSAVTEGEEHPQLLAQAVRSNPERFESLGDFPVTRAGRVIEGAIEVWRFHPARLATPRVDTRQPLARNRPRTLTSRESPRGHRHSFTAWPPPDREQRSAQAVAQKPIDPAGAADEDPVPEPDMRESGLRATEQELVDGRGQQPERVQHDQALPHQPRRGEPDEGVPRVSTVVADGAVELGEQPWPGRRQHHEHAARPQQAGGTRDFSVVVLDVLQHVEIQDGIEGRGRGEVGHGRLQDLARGLDQPGSDGLGHTGGQSPVRLQADPASLARATQHAGVGPDAGAHLQDVSPQIGGNLLAPVVLPPRCLREDLELIADVGGRLSHAS